MELNSKITPITQPIEKYLIIKILTFMQASHLQLLIFGLRNKEDITQITRNPDNSFQILKYSILDDH